MDLSGLVPRACPVCGSPDGGTVVAEQDIDPAALDGFAFASRKVPEYMHYRLVACAVCDVAYADPAPTAEMLVGAYQQADFDSGDESQRAAQTYGRLVESLHLRTAHPLRPSRALDIGAGDGAFLDVLLAAGWQEVAGVEPSDAPRLGAKDHIRPLIHGGLFSSEAFAGRRFDLITCLQTIEHVADPLALCRQAYSLLAEGGALLIVCHNRRAASATLMGQRSPIFDVEHLQLFSRRSVKALLERAGFRGVAVRPVLNRYPLRYWARLAPLPGAIKTPAMRTLQGPLGALPLTLPAGNLAAVGYRTR